MILAHSGAFHLSMFCASKVAINKPHATSRKSTVLYSSVNKEMNWKVITSIVTSV